MKTTTKNITLIIIVLLSALLATTWCGLIWIVFNPDSIADPPLYGPGGSSGSPYSGNYKIDTDTIVKSIDSEQFPIFFPEMAQISRSNTSGNLHWTQSEYLKVVFALFKFEWKEWPKYWTVNRMLFRRKCEDNPVGFESANFLFDQLIYKKEFRYNTRAIEISLPDGDISWGSGGGRPLGLFDYLGEHDLDDLKITADDALNLAEKSGGKVARQLIQNNCEIAVHLSQYWEIRYYGPLERALKLFEIFIDPYTGKIISSR